MCKAFLKREYPFFLLFLHRQWEAYSLKKKKIWCFYKNLNANFTFPLLPAIKWLGRWEAQPSGQATPLGTPQAVGIHWGLTSHCLPARHRSPLGCKSRGHRRARRAGKQHAASPEPILSQMCKLQRCALQINTCASPSHALYLWGMSAALRGSVIFISPFCNWRGQLKFSKLLCSFRDLLGRLRFIQHNEILYV